MIKSLEDFEELFNFQKRNGRYTGSYFEGKKEGFGIIYFENGEKFMGSFKCDLAEGHGTYYCFNGEKVIGIWKKGCLSQKIGECQPPYNYKLWCYSNIIFGSDMISEELPKIIINNREDFVKDIHYDRNSIICVY